MAEFAAEIVEMGDKLAGLTLKQAVEIADYLKETYGIEPAAGGGGMMMAAAAAPGEAAAEEEEQTEFTVVLAGAGDQKIKVIKVVREVTGLGLKEAKELVDSAPKEIKENLPKEEADKLKEQLEEAGASVELK